MATLPRSRIDRLLSSRRGRALQENLTAYIFLFPALVLLFVFGIYPVGFALFVSLHRWRRFPGEYLGLSNYTQALDSLAYVLFFWLSVGILIYAGLAVVRLWKQTASERLPALSALIPGAFNSAALVLLLNWITVLLPIILNIPQQLRGQERTPGLFVDTLFASFQTPDAAAAGTPFLIAALLALGVNFLWLRVVRAETRVNWWL